MPKNYEELTITDNFMFCKVMSDKELCKEVIETLLSIKIDHIEQIHSEHTLNPDVLSKGVRYDVYIKDSDNVYDIELQMRKEPDLALRTRYYQSVFDIDMLEHGWDYKNLKQTFIIFLCPFDCFECDYPVLTFENMARENTDIKLNDKVLKIFYNFNRFQQITDEDRKHLLQYFSSGASESSLGKKLNKAVETARGNQPWRKEYMTLGMMLEDERYRTIEELQPVIDSLKNEVSGLQNENADLHNENANLQNLNNIQQQQIEELKKQIEALKNK